MSTHRKYSPSGASRWLACPGSLNLPQTEPEEGSVYAQEGSAAHRLAHQCYLINGDPSKFIGREIDGFEVDQEMSDAVQVYIDTIEAELAAIPGQQKSVLMEDRRDHPKMEDFGGTIDCLIVSDSGITIVDFKYGAGVKVEVEENAQLSCYALIALANSPFTDMPSMKITVVQPRAKHDDGPVRSWIVSKKYIEAFAELVVAAMKDDSTNTVPGDHCRWCNCKAGCPSLEAMTRELAQREFQEEGITPERAAEILGMKKLVKTYLDAVDVWAHAQAKQGVDIPGFKLVNIFTNRVYSVDETEVARLCRNRKFGKKVIYETKLLSPAKLEKVIGKDLISTMVERKCKGTTLVPEADRRAAVELLSPTDEFSQENTDG